MVRPRKPGYASIDKVLGAIRECSCGKYREWDLAKTDRVPFSQRMKMLYECECVGPKYWSELLSITKLHRNTLCRTCNFLVKHRVLLRRVENRKGHFVRYFTAHTELGLVDEIHRPEERWPTKPVLRAFDNLSRGSETLKKFCSKHRAEIKALQDTYGVDVKEMPMPNAVALVRFVNIYGIHDGARRYLELRNLDPGEEDAVKAIFSVRGRIPNLDEARAYAAYRERKYGIKVLRLSKDSPEKTH